MSINVGTGISTEHDPYEAGAAAAQAAGEALGERADVAVVFASGTHLLAPEASLEGVHDVLRPAALVGCGAGGVLEAGRELESGTALAVWAATFGDGAQITTFHAELRDDGAQHTISGLPDLQGSSGMIMLSEPHSFPTDAALALLSCAAPGVPVLGGLASARTPAGSGLLFVGDEVCERGAVGLRLEGVEILPCVSQGAAPVGRELTITSADGNMINELAGQPALQTVEQVLGELSPRERTLVAGGLLIGLVIDGGKPDYEQGDFLVRAVLGADPDTGALAVGALVRTGQVVRLHARDASSAEADLNRALRLRAQALDGAPPAGALVFSCNGRGAAMFGVRDHDAAAIQRELQGAPAAGFFAAGEIGPVGGRSFLHGYTATVAVFPR